jgi:hypothetical protein
MILVEQRIPTPFLETLVYPKAVGILLGPRERVKPGGRGLDTVTGNLSLYASRPSLIAVRIGL